CFVPLPSHIKPEEQNISILHDVVLSLGTHEPLIARGLHASHTLEIGKGYGLGANETALEIRVDHPSRLRRFRPYGNGPGSDLLYTGGEIRVQAEKPVSSPNQAMQPGLLESQRREELGPLFVPEFGQLRFDLARDRDNLGHLAALLHRLSQ